MRDTYVLQSMVCPTLRITRDPDGTLNVDADVAEWAVQREADNFATWLAPIVEACGDHDDIARTIGVELVPLRRIGAEFAKIAQTVGAARVLRKSHGLWRFTGGPCPTETRCEP